MMTIRPGTSDDLAALMRIARDMHEESRYAVLPFDEGKMARCIQGVIESEDGYCAVAEDNGVVVGAILATLYEPVFSRKKLAQDYGVFMMHEWRGGLTASRLVHGYLEWAQKAGAVWAEIGVTTGVTPAQTGRLLELCGMRWSGALYCKGFVPCA